MTGQQHSIYQETTMETPNSQPVPTAPATDDKTLAIVAYLTLIGFIAAIVLHNSPGKKTALGATIFARSWRSSSQPSPWRSSVA
jgi:hypothetical protein